jgi:hypothetical protein
MTQLYCRWTSQGVNTALAPCCPTPPVYLGLRGGCLGVRRQQGPLPSRGSGLPDRAEVDCLSAAVAAVIDRALPSPARGYPPASGSASWLYLRCSGTSATSCNSPTYGPRHAVAAMRCVQVACGLIQADLPWPRLVLQLLWRCHAAVHPLWSVPAESYDGRVLGLETLRPYLTPACQLGGGRRGGHPGGGHCADGAGRLARPVSRFGLAAVGSVVSRCTGIRASLAWPPAPKGLAPPAYGRRRGYGVRPTPHVHAHGCRACESCQHCCRGGRRFKVLLRLVRVAGTAPADLGACPGRSVVSRLCVGPRHAQRYPGRRLAPCVPAGVTAWRRGPGVLRPPRLNCRCGFPTRRRLRMAARGRGGRDRLDGRTSYRTFLASAGGLCLCSALVPGLDRP